VSPAQRVLAHALRQDANLGGGRLICIEGPAGSGKTTLSQLVAETAEPDRSVTLVHLDDLYDGWAQDLSQVGPVLLEQVVAPLATGLPAGYRRYDWLRSQYAEWVALPSSDLLILEGVGAGHPVLAGSRATLVWVEADPALCLARGLARDGEGLRGHWLEWQRREADYFERFAIAKQADVVLDTSSYD
jgi:hypothetical protein